MTEQEKIADKIQKLLALATSDQPGEAEAASAKALELMMRYNLSQADVARKPFIRENVENFPPADPAYPFIAHLLVDFFHVRVVCFSEEDPILGATFKSIAFMGEPHHVEIATFMGTYLIRAFHDSWHRAYRDDHLRKNVQHDFYYGMLEGLTERLTETRTKVYKETGSDLVISTTNPALNRFVDGHFPVLRSSNRRGGSLDPAALASGAAAGSNVRIQRAVRGEASRGGKFIT